MNGPQHYRAAEKLAASADIAIGQAEDGREYKLPIARVILAEAQVHATLALAAATALHSVGEQSRPEVFNATVPAVVGAWADLLDAESTDSLKRGAS